MGNPQVLEGEDKPEREVDLGKRPHFVLGRVAETSDISLVRAIDISQMTLVSPPAPVHILLPAQSMRCVAERWRPCRTTAPAPDSTLPSCTIRTGDCLSLIYSRCVLILSTFQEPLLNALWLVML